MGWNETLSTWGELCVCAEIELGETPAEVASVERNSYQSVSISLPKEG